MGICSSAKNANSHSHGSENIEKNGNLEYRIDSEPETSKMIINRLSDRTKFDDINKYLTISSTFLGKGATGIVRIGYNIKNEKYAIKTVWKADVEQNECFKREIDITLELNHENIVKCEEIYEDNSAIHFVLQLIEGGDLFEHIIHSTNRKLNENEALDILEQILQALHYLHDEMNIVHRDIKPENFLMYNENGRNKIILIDFGFATYARNDDEMTQQLGTPQYAAPEIFNEIPYTNKVDMWSTGIVLYNMIIGLQPFSSNLNSIKEQVLHKDIDFSGFKNQKIKELCMGLLNRDFHKRYNSFQALSLLNLIKDCDPTQQTIPSSFNPDIHKIIFILNNNKVVVDDLRNLLIKHLSLNDIRKIMSEINKNNEEDYNNEIGMLNGRRYMKLEKIINLTQNQSFVSEEFKDELTKFKENAGEDKIRKQMVNSNKFFATVIESMKFIQKQRILNEFKKYDKKNLGYLKYHQMQQIFIDPNKYKNIQHLYNKNSKIQFEEFYKIWNEYEGIKINPQNEAAFYKRYGSIIDINKKK